MKFHNYKNWMAGADCVVVGGGPSADPGAYNSEQDRAQCYTFPMADDYRDVWTIACNRAVTFADPDCAVCIDDHHDPVWGGLAPYTAPVYFTPHEPGMNYPPRTVQIGNFNGNDNGPDNPDDLLRMPTMHIPQCPFYAIAVATYLGFKTVGVIGVDLTEDRYPKVDGINRAYHEMVGLCGDLGTRVINLSPDSRCTAIPPGTWDEVRTK